MCDSSSARCTQLANQINQEDRFLPSVLLVLVSVLPGCMPTLGWRVAMLKETGNNVHSTMSGFIDTG